MRRSNFDGWNSKFWLGVFVLSLAACASPQKKWADQAFQTRIYEGTYDQVWLASLKALSDYPLKISNKDNGKIHSEIINGPYNDLLFTWPEPLELPERFRYAVSLKFAQFQTDTGMPLVRVRIEKELERYRDFYAGWARFPSDGVEEKVLLYRIAQILNIEKKLDGMGL